jgi:hypothetical protein
LISTEDGGAVLWLDGFAELFQKSAAVVLMLAIESSNAMKKLGRMT